jgi:hypothetical protein
LGTAQFLVIAILLRQIRFFLSFILLIYTIEGEIQFLVTVICWCQKQSTIYLDSV